MAPLPVPTSGDVERRVAAVPGKIHDRVDEVLGLLPRYEHRRVDREFQPVELPDADDVGQRLAGQPPAQELFCNPQTTVRDSLPQRGEEAGAVHAERRAQQHLGFEACVGYARVGQTVPGAGPGLAEHQKPTSSSFISCSRVIINSIRSSISPSSTASRLCRVYDVR